MKTTTITILSENKPGVLYRISNLFLRRKINIESLSVSEIKKPGFSRFIIVVNEDEALVQKISKQLARIIEVLEVSIQSNETSQTTSVGSEIAKRIQVSIIKRIELAGRAVNALSLAQGIPSFETAKYIKDAVKTAMETDRTDKYTPGYGIEPLRGIIVKKLKRDNGITATNSQVIVTHGAIEALMAIFMGLLNPHDDVVMPTPNYASHITQLRIALGGRSPIFVPFDETKEGWTLDIDKLEKAITPATKAILICNPSNPTGKVYSRQELKAIAKLAIKYDLWIVADEIYEYFTYEGRKHVSIGSFPEVADRTISVFGVSKSYAMTGWRIGYVVGPQKYIDEVFKIHDSLVTCPTAVSQYAALAAMKGDQKDVAFYKGEFEKRRAITAIELAKCKKLTYTTPHGAYYAFPKLTVPVDDVELSMRLIKEAKVSVVPGSPFGKGGEGHIRISYGVEEDALREGLRRLVKYLNENL